MISPYHGSEELIRKRDSSRIESYATFFVSVEGRSQINLEKTKDLFDLVVSNSKSNSYRITIHLDYFPPSTSLFRTCCLGSKPEMRWFYAIRYSNRNIR
jgi:hypothetical protein